MFKTQFWATKDENIRAKRNSIFMDAYDTLLTQHPLPIE
jgi:hypothetical protein